MHKFLFYNKFIICLYMFRALCAHNQEVKIVYAASGIITPVGGGLVHTCADTYRLCIGYKHFSNHTLLNCSLHTDAKSLEFHEVLEDCSSAVYSTYSHLMCRIIQQLRRYLRRMSPTSAETRRNISETLYLVV